MKRTALLSLALASALSLTACGGDSDDAAPASPTSKAATDSSSASSTESASPGIVSPSLPVVPAFSVPPNGIISDITVDSCDMAKGPVKASGTAKNSGKFTRDLVVVVNWAVASTGDVLARGIATMPDVPPGETRDWETAADLAGDDPVVCVPTAYAGQLK